MNQNIIIKKALENGRFTLNESESKVLLAQYGACVVNEIAAESPEQAAKAAEETGFPIVLKGLGDQLTHKSEMGMVRVGLHNAQSVQEAAKSMLKTAAGDLEGFLVQPQIQGDREFVAGLFTDPLFGPVIMFGVGGVFTEALGDVAFKLAPCSRADVEDMLSELRAAGLLGEFRGQPAVDREQIVSILEGLSRLAAENPSVIEVDVNPLKAGPDGRLTAVDALVILEKERREKDFLPPVPPREIARFFHPRSIAVVGASGGFGKWGHIISINLISGGYEGSIYLVNPKGGRLFNRPVFRNVAEIPGAVDLACVTIPAAGIADLIPEFKAKGIRHVLLITSGFGETGPKGKALEQDLAAKAREAGIYILGPNTMGISNPHIKCYCTGSQIQPEPGSTALLSQSGNMGGQLMAFAHNQGIGIRAFSGSGNEAMLTIEDGLEGFEVDELTKTVMLYVESVKNGRRFYESAKRLGRKKPVVVLKGGRTPAGGRAAASHTGAMASDIKVFDAVCRQAGIVSVERPMDLLDLSAAFSSLPLPRGNRTAIMTLGGGWGVVTADLCNKCELEVPPLSGEIIKKIDKVLPPFWSRSNPIDLVGETNPEIFLDILEHLASWDGCDAVLVLGILGRRHAFARMVENATLADPTMDPRLLDAPRKNMEDFEKRFVLHTVDLMESLNKPILGVFLARTEEDKTVVHIPGKKYSGVFFETPERAVKSLAGMCEYHRFHSRKQK